MFRHFQLTLIVLLLSSETVMGADKTVPPRRAQNQDFPEAIAFRRVDPGIPGREVKLDGVPIPDAEYLCDTTHKWYGNISRFQLKWTVLDYPSQGRDVRVISVSKVHDGESYAFWWRVYTWRAPAMKFVRQEHHPPEEPAEDFSRLLTLHGEKSELRMSQLRKYPTGQRPQDIIDTRLQIAVIEYEKPDAQNETVERVKVGISVYPSFPLQLPQEVAGEEYAESWLATGDEVRNAQWKLCVHRIVLPDIDSKNPGRVELQMLPPDVPTK